MINKIALVLAFAFTAACASAPKSDSDVGPRLDDIAYRALFEKNSRNDQQYNGFQNTLEIHATFLNSDIQTVILQKNADNLQWDSKTAQQEREKLFQQNSNSTKFFVSFFVPTPRLNDLNKPNSIWKIILEANGEKYPGKAERMKRPLETLQATYPTHTRWGVPYEVTFPVPLSMVENGEVKLIITSNIAASNLKFAPVSK